MSDLETEFQHAVDKVRNAPSTGGFKPTRAYMLKMYALFRQAKDGDVRGKRPSVLKVIERAKHDAWAGTKGKNREDAMREYIAEVESVEQQYG